MNDKDLTLVNAVINNPVLRVTAIGKLLDMMHHVAFTSTGITVFEQIITAERESGMSLPDARENANRLVLLDTIDAVLPLLAQVGQVMREHAKRIVETDKENA